MNLKGNLVLEFKVSIYKEVRLRNRKKHNIIGNLSYAWPYVCTTSFNPQNLRITPLADEGPETQGSWIQVSLLPNPLTFSLLTETRVRIRRLSVSQMWAALVEEDLILKKK